MKEEILLKDLLNKVEIQMRENNLEGIKAFIKNLPEDIGKDLENKSTS